MRRPARLSATFVRTVNVPGRYGDGRGGQGLSLLVKRRARGGFAKSFSQRLRINGRAVNVGVGPYPLVSLAEARATALSNWQLVRRGDDPRRPRVLMPTFESASETVVRLHAPNWRNSGKTAKLWRARLKAYAFPKLGHKTVDNITSSDVLDVLLPIWNDKRDTARRVRQHIGAIMKWAVAQGYRSDNPAGETIGAALPRSGGRAEHYQALPHAEVASALEVIRSSNAGPTTKLAFEFLTLTAARSGEARMATWAEIDFKSAIWTVPAERTKSGSSHRVPLSDDAILLLLRARVFRDESDLIFPSPRGKALSDSTISKLVRENGIACVPHGMRSSFRDWCADTGVPRDVAESSLAHAVSDSTEAAYFRSDLLERRRVVMQAWADHLRHGVERALQAAHTG